MRIKILAKVFLICYGAIATILMTYAMFNSSTGVPITCFYEKNLFISIVETILGIITAVYLFTIASLQIIENFIKEKGVNN